MRSALARQALSLRSPPPTARRGAVCLCSRRRFAIMAHRCPTDGRPEQSMCERDERDDWLEGVRRWYFGGTPGPDDETAACAEVDAIKSADMSAWPSDDENARLGRHA